MDFPLIRIMGGGIPYPNKLPSFMLAKLFELNIFPNHHQLDDQQVQEYLTIPNI